MFKGRGTVATGRVEQGTIKVGEEVEVLGLRQVSSSVFFFLISVKYPWAFPYNKLISLSLLIGCVPVSPLKLRLDLTFSRRSSSDLCSQSILGISGLNIEFFFFFFPILFNAGRSIENYGHWC